jgi:hypothetical protein
MGATYRVMLDGVAAGRDRDEAATHLVRIFKLSEDAARALLDGRGVVIREGLDRDAAIRCRGVLERAGCIAIVNREIASIAATGSATQPPALPDELESLPSELPASKLAGIPKAYFALGAALALVTALLLAIAR